MHQVLIVSLLNSNAEMLNTSSALISLRHHFEKAVDTNRGNYCSKTQQVSEMETNVTVSGEHNENVCHHHHHHDDENNC